MRSLGLLSRYPRAERTLHPSFYDLTGKIKFATLDLTLEIPFDTLKLQPTLHLWMYFLDLLRGRSDRRSLFSATSWRKEGYIAKYPVPAANVSDTKADFEGKPSAREEEVNAYPVRWHNVEAEDILEARQLQSHRRSDRHPNTYLPNRSLPDSCRAGLAIRVRGYWVACGWLGWRWSEVYCNSAELQTAELMAKQIPFIRGNKILIGFRVAYSYRFSIGNGAMAFGEDHDLPGQE
ncbi:hypothetical protein B0H17DRAFT_1134502 [Mycena rosella]|uniref:Uncharacterized protein n=1 Tax=Mycena rosella TaxID=1033263 RepID=A0AAD7GGV2_MYCRO|nr:hypothetical protein B0H17DRAFT_1134502 [Mycena rosella]